MKLVVVTIFVLFFINLNAQDYTLHYNNDGYKELDNELILCKDSIPRHK